MAARAKSATKAGWCRSWDVPATSAHYNPAPPRLLARVHKELAALLAVPAIAIASAAQAAEHANRALSYRVNGDDLDARFHDMRARFQPVP